MRKNFADEDRYRVLLCLCFWGILIALFVAPSYFRSSADTSQKADQNIEAHHETFDNYDIRSDKHAFEKIANFRSNQGKAASEIADLRDEFVIAETELKRRVPTLKVEFNQQLNTPEVISPDVKQGHAFLTESSTEDRAEILRGFAKRNNRLLGATNEQLEQLRVTADYKNPDKNLSFAHLKQFVGEIPVFQGEIKAGFTRDGKIIRIINRFAPNLKYKELSADFGDPLNAVKSAAGYINHTLNESDLISAESESDNRIVKLGKGDWATTAEKIYFPTEPGVAVPAWKILIWEPVDAYYVIVDAKYGNLLWRKNITDHQTQPVTYNVYANPNAMINVADSPAPMSPGPLTPATGVQGNLINRTTLTFIGNELPYSFNNKGWIEDGKNITDGNAVEAGLDRVTPDGVDSPAEGSSLRNFTFNYNPPPGNPPPGDSPLDAPSQKGAVTQLFYTINRFHDELYLLGFNEQAGNFQQDNFDRGGVGNDRVSAQAQDIFCAPNAPATSCVNNANFGTPGDGARGRMQMFLWTATTPNRDGALDAEIVLHEMTHGLSNRLHGDATGLSTTMARGMGEGWSDFYAYALLSEPSDPLDGVYATGGYSVIRTEFNGNYYYGIRKFPKAIMSSKGGPENRPHNPLTFADIDSTQMNLNDGAFPRGPYGPAGADAPHAVGEVWSSALWEVRAKFIARLGWQVGNRRVLQYITDAMKISPSAPDFIQSRDAIIAAAQASVPQGQENPDVADIWEGFRIRGMGYSAKVLAAGTGSGDTRVFEAFDAPNLLQAPAFSFTDTTGGDGDGFAEPGETITLTIPLSNNTGRNADNVVLQISGGQAVDFGTIANNSTSTKTINFTVPNATPCGNIIVLTFQISSSLGATNITRNLTIGTPIETFSENFDGVTAPAIPNGWTVTSTNNAMAFVTSTNFSDTAPNSAFAIDPTSVGGSTDLTSPAITINSSAATLSFRNRFVTEAGWDGGVLEISIGTGAYQDILLAGGSFIQNGYNTSLGDGGSGNVNPIKGRPAWSGNSGGFVTTIVQLPVAAAGQEIHLRWKFGADDNTAEIGWNVDTIKVFGRYSCSGESNSKKVRADFDGDGKTDLSVFRPSEGNWYLMRSNAGFTGLNFGAAGDVLTPGDYDGDGKADFAVKRGESWYVLNSSNGAFQGFSWGSSTDIPTPADYDGDGKTDIAVFRPSNGIWYILLHSGAAQYIQFGQAGDIPVPADYDGDGKADIAVYRQGIWYLLRSSVGFLGVAFGAPTDIPLPADYNGDGKDDVSVFRPSDGAWYHLNLANGTFYGMQFGQNGDVPVPGDYDGDGRYDQAVYRAGLWYVMQSRAGFYASPFGAATDQPIPRYYTP